MEFWFLFFFPQTMKFDTACVFKIYLLWLSLLNYHNIPQNQLQLEKKNI